MILYLKFLTCNSSNLTILTPNIEKVKHLIQLLNQVPKRKHSVNWNIDNYISNQLMYEFSVEMESENSKDNYSLFVKGIKVNH